MDSILKALRDPSWWFTVIIIGIFVGVLGGLLKDGLKTAVPQLIQRYRQSRKERKAADQQQVDFWISNPDVMRLEFAALGLQFCLMIVFIVLLMGFPLLVAAGNANPDFRVIGPLVLGEDRVTKRVAGLFFVVLWAPGGLLMWWTFRKHWLLLRAFEAFKAKKSDSRQ